MYFDSDQFTSEITGERHLHTGRVRSSSSRRFSSLSLRELWIAGRVKTVAVALA